MSLMGLYNNILDNIKEAHMKLGYSVTDISLNYQERSLRHFVGDGDLEGAMDQLFQLARPTLGEMSYRIKGPQVRITVPAQGVRFVGENVPEKPHLRELIELVQQPGVTIEQIRATFDKYSDHVECRTTDESGMDYVLWFPQGEPDDYRYCVCLDGLGATYHRLSKMDFEDIYQ